MWARLKRQIIIDVSIGLQLRHIPIEECSTKSSYVIKPVSIGKRGSSFTTIWIIFHIIYNIISKLRFKHFVPAIDIGNLCYKSKLDCVICNKFKLFIFFVQLVWFNIELLVLRFSILFLVRYAWLMCIAGLQHAPCVS